MDADGDDEDDDLDLGAGAGVSVEGGPRVSPAFLSTVRYTDAAVAGALSEPSRRAIAERFRFDFLSKVQAATLPLIIDGKDVFAKAKTGSGKTLAFLIPLMELLRAEDAARAASRRPAATGVRSLVIAPTRELALQILKEAETLLAFDPAYCAHAVIGGRNINGEKSRMGFGGGRTSARVDVLIATPGRLIDHMESTPGFLAALASVRVLVLDEADRMLDMGFKPALDRIFAALPSNGTSAAAAGGAGGAGAFRPGAFAVGGAAAASGVVRQTLLFSATVPREVMGVAGSVMRRGYDFIDCVGEEEPDTNVHVYQEFLVVRQEHVLPALARILDFNARADPAHKILVFFPTARITGYLATLFGPKREGGLGFNIVEIHSRKSQSARNAAAERFKREKGIVMFSSDVTARGMDFPDVTRVIQVGLTDREQYVHRLGRTARAGKSGAGLLLLADYEAASLLPELKDIPLHPAGPGSLLTGGAAAGVAGYAGAPSYAPITAGGGAALPKAPPLPTRGAATPVAPAVASTPDLDAVLAGVAARGDLTKEASAAYSACLGFYNGQLRRVGWSKPQLVAEINKLFLTLGLREVPMMPRDTLGKMGLRGTPGLREGPKGWKPGHD